VRLPLQEGCGAAPWLPRAAHLAQAPVGPLKPAPHGAAVQRASPPWTGDGVRRVASWMPLPRSIGGRDDYLPAPWWS
jgi:hypothetical protein